MFGPFGKCEGPYLAVFCFVELVLFLSCLFAGSFGGFLLVDNGYALFEV